MQHVCHGIHSHRCTTRSATWRPYNYRNYKQQHIFSASTVQTDVQRRETVEWNNTRQHHGWEKKDNNMARHVLANSTWGQPHFRGWLNPLFWGQPFPSLPLCNLPFSWIPSIFLSSRSPRRQKVATRYGCLSSGVHAEPWPQKHFQYILSQGNTSGANYFGFFWGNHNVDLNERARQFRPHYLRGPTDTLGLASRIF